MNAFKVYVAGYELGKEYNREFFEVERQAETSEQAARDTLTECAALKATPAEVFEVRHVEVLL